MHEISRYVNELQALPQDEYTRKAVYYSNALRDARDRLNAECEHRGIRPFSQRKMKHPRPRAQPKNSRRTQQTGAGKK